MKKQMIIAALLVAGPVLLLSSCGDKEARMGKGFRLPEGDAEKGNLAFTELKCHQCHSVSGVEFPKDAEKSDVHFALGGGVRKVMTYGELVTAIIQPQHVISSEFRATLEKEKRADAVSPMPDYNDTMTIRQLTDLVTFLHAHYTKVLPEYDVNPMM